MKKSEIKTDVEYAWQSSKYNKPRRVKIVRLSVAKEPGRSMYDSGFTGVEIEYLDEGGKYDSFRAKGTKHIVKTREIVRTWTDHLALVAAQAEREAAEKAAREAQEFAFDADRRAIIAMLREAGVPSEEIPLRVKQPHIDRPGAVQMSTADLLRILTAVKES